MFSSLIMFVYVVFCMYNFSFQSKNSSSESDIFGDNSDLDPDLVPGTDSNLNSNSSCNNVDLVKESSDLTLSDVEISPRPESIKGRKNKKNPDRWKRAQQNKKRLSGEEYKNRSDHTVAAKIFSDKLCICARKCNEKISSGKRKTLFKSFYRLPNNTEQNIFLNDCIISKSIMRRRPVDRSEPTRLHSFLFFYPSQ